MRTCEHCGGSGRCPDSCLDCFDCMGTGRVPEGSGGYDVRWEAEDAFNQGWPSGNVRVPDIRPQVIRLSARPELVAGKSYTFELNFHGIILAYGGVPLEDCDLHPDMVVARLDRAISITARRE